MNYRDEFRKFAIKDQGISGSVFDDYSKTIENMTQYVIEERPGNFRAIDVFTRLISDR
ncbi:MAG: ATP-dependent Clp protease proteolytic subunit, partial [Cyclobacteriaceae bacterium]|nr:ATP-dependent Clp protease proteolytic subunit [Cyclobacteriaceae bacterium]